MIFTNLRDANIARQAEWDRDSQISLSYRGNELAGETGEACNEIKKIERERLGIRGSRTTREKLAEELADVIICADLIAMAEEIDLDAAVAAKFNKTSIGVGLKTRLLRHPLAPREGRPDCAFCAFGKISGLTRHADYCDVTAQLRELGVLDNEETI